MTLTILAFGIVKDIFGASTILVELPDATSSGGLKAYLEQQYPQLKKIASYLLTVNSEYAADDLLLKGTDEVAVIPPVSGG